MSRCKEPTSPLPSHAQNGSLSAPRLSFCPSACIASLTVDIPEAHRPPCSFKARSRRQKTELALHSVIMAWALLKAVQIGRRISNVRRLQLTNSRLAKDYLGHYIDLSDPQYRRFRGNICGLVGLAAICLALSHWQRRCRPSHRLATTCFSALMVTTLLHGASAIKILTILLVNFAIARALAGRSLYQPLVFVLNLCFLFLNDLANGYKFGHISSQLIFLDSWSGVLPRWHILFNFSMLRIVSFGIDLHWARSPPKQNARIASHGVQEYSLQAFLAYVLYPPLYIAGPIMPFDDFLAQLKDPPRITARMVAGYAMRLTVCFLTMECILHNIYVVAIKYAKAWTGDSPSELAMIGMWNLIIIWLKLLIPWRFFRLWALLDGIDPPENMVRCVINNYSTMGFWRSWHRSYNRWLLRYLYAPLGGSLWSRLLIFTFVAIWHDLRLHLFVWGWVVFLFILPEILASRYLPESEYGTEWWYRHACALGGALNILMMIIANLIGFVLGTDGALYFFRRVFSSWQGFKFAAICLVVFHSAVHVQLAYREEEKKAGVSLKC